jgi:uncharacterized protein (DUF1499 family)
MKRCLGMAAGILGGISVLCLLLSGPGYRLGFWGLYAGITLVRIAGWIGIASVGLGVIAFQRRRAWWWIGVGLGLGTTLVTLSWKHAAASVPPIHDITTDTENPPPFQALLTARKASPNGAAYGGPVVAQAQHAAYPDIAPVTLDKPVDQVFAHCLAVARKLGWSILTDDSRIGTIEATATTLWFGFKDDVVIRVTAEGPNKARVDLRSASRVGKSDIGTNAARIRSFFRHLAES